MGFWDYFSHCLVGKMVTVLRGLWGMDSPRYRVAVQFLKFSLEMTWKN